MPRHISWLHNSFIDAGLDLILTNSFSGNSPAHVVAIVSALNNTAKRTFDPAAMTAALGTAWGGVSTSGGENATCGNRPGRRRQRREPSMD